jgi:hypothetical protein
MDVLVLSRKVKDTWRINKGSSQGYILAEGILRPPSSQDYNIYGGWAERIVCHGSLHGFDLTEYDYNPIWTMQYTNAGSSARLTLTT